MLLPVGLNASAGISYNKFLAKLASDLNKPNGQAVITPARGPDFVAALPVRKFHGIGPATATRMERLGIVTGADLRDRPPEFLRQHFGKSGEWYHRIARGIDHRPVEPTLGYRIEHEGTVAAIAGDTVPCPGLDELCAGADLYVQTVIRRDLVALVPSARLQDILDYHSSVEQAAQTAARAGVGTLVLTHYVPPLQRGQEDEWRAIAARHFDGPIVLGDDLTRAGAG